MSIQEKIKTVLVTGNLGYIGSVLVPCLKHSGYYTIGFDTAYYNQDCSLYLNPEESPHQQIIKDIRQIDQGDLKGIDGIIHLAALSNDPLGEFNPQITEEINFKATIRLAELAKEAGIQRFVFASSQSMYGIADTTTEVEEDNSQKNPLTAYARTKWEAECHLKELSDEQFTVVCYRPSTVFGASPKLRCDIVFNNLMASAFLTGKIEIKSDGTPWRPIVHVKDVSQAFISGLEAPDELVQRQSFNVGIENGNYTVRELAESVQKTIIGSDLTFTGEHGSDSRTYRVSFTKILTILKDYYQPQFDLISGGQELLELFKSVDFKSEDFKGRKCTRLAQLKYLISHNHLDENLYWLNS